MSKSEAVELARRMADHGRHVFVYNHVWTNQVVYSLERSLNNNHALKQLPFAGKKTLPATLRKDLWRPLLTVSFPSVNQGLHAFRRLREYRKLHELQWETPKVQFPDPDSDSNERVVRDRFKKAKSRTIMDQKANTVADLAQVLKEQDELGQEKERKDNEAREKEQHRIREEMLSLANEAEQGGLPILDQTIHAQEEALKAMRDQKAAKDPAAPSRRLIGETRLALDRLRLKRQKMVAATDAIEQAKQQGISTAQANEARGKATPDSIELTIEPPEIFYQSDAVKQRGKTVENVPVYTTNGVIIRWTQPLDAEYAASWPQAIVHEAAGLARHTAPAIDQEAAFAVEELALRNTSNKYRELRAQRINGLELGQQELDETVPTDLLSQPEATQQNARP